MSLTSDELEQLSSGRDAHDQEQGGPPRLRPAAQGKEHRGPRQGQVLGAAAAPARYAEAAVSMLGRTRPRARAQLLRVRAHGARAALPRPQARWCAWQSSRRTRQRFPRATSRCASARPPPRGRCCAGGRRCVCLSACPAPGALLTRALRDCAGQDANTHLARGRVRRLPSRSGRAGRRALPAHVSAAARSSASCACAPC